MPSAGPSKEAQRPRGGADHDGSMLDDDEDLGIGRMYDGALSGDDTEDGGSPLVSFHEDQDSDMPGGVMESPENPQENERGVGEEEAPGHSQEEGGETKQACSV